MKGWAQKTFASMTLEQKLGQLMVPFLDDEGAIRELARAGTLGGLYSVAGRTVREAAEWVADIQQEAAIPLLLCSDFETGSTFAGGTPLPSPMAVGATGDEDLAREAGRVTAREVGAIGFRFMGSPVVDINRPSNPIVSTRAYGEEPDAVSRMALAYAAGVQSEGVIACLKHFPGTGDIDLRRRASGDPVPRRADRSLAGTDGVSNYDEGTGPDWTSGRNEEWNHLERVLRRRFSVMTVIRVTTSARPQVDPADFDTLIFGVFVRHMANSKDGGVLPDRQKAILSELLARSRTAFILSFGSPYPVADLSDRWGCLCAYSDCADSVEAAVRVLAGELPAKGQLLPSLARFSSSG